MASLRPKIGYAFSNRFMAYATGGLALARETQWRDQYISNLADETLPNGTETTVFSVEKAAATRAGFVIGGGLEYALNDNWSIKADYTYNRFGKKDFRFRNARAGTGRDYTTTTSTIVGYETVDPSHRERPQRLERPRFPHAEDRPELPVLKAGRHRKKPSRRS
jgi:hemoglobin/transferrin/lactoferrin receptor protein